MENGDETLTRAAAEHAAPNGGIAEEEQVPPVQAAKSYAAVVADNPAPDGGVAEDEKVEAGTTDVAKTYAAVAARAEIDDLRAANQELEGKLAEARRENQAVASEAHRVEGVFAQAREEVTLAEDAAASSEKEAASLRAELQRLRAVLEIEKGDREMDKRKHEEVAKEVEAVRREKVKLEEEIKVLKASAAALTDRDASLEAEAPKEMEFAWQGMAATAAVSAAVTAAVVLVYLRLKR